MRSLEQKRAAAALSAVAQWTGNSGLRAELENLPTLVAVNGLLTALLRLRKEDSDVLVPLEAWLVSPESPAGLRTNGLPLDKFLTAADGATYRRATREALLFATWLKKWAQAYIPKAPKQQPPAAISPDTGGEHANP